MSNRRMHLSEEGKKILDIISEQLELDRPTTVKIALAKGIQVSDGAVKEDFTNIKNKWTIPDNIIKEKEFLLFKHLIFNELEQQLEDEVLHDFMLSYIEKGLRVLKDIYEKKTSMEDFRLLIL